MTTLHAMFDSREKIKRTVKNRPNDAEATTESDDKKIAALIQEHVPAMESRVHEDAPLPPMTFHPIFVNLIKHADDYTLTYEETEKGMKVTYEADDPFVIMLVQEHAKLVSRFINNGMEEIHKPYTLPSHEGESAVSKTRHLLLTSLIGTRTIFERIALNEEQHMSWLAIQLDLLERMGESAYISKHIPVPVTGTP